MMRVLFPDGEDLDQRVVGGVLSGHDLPLVSTHSINDHVARLANRRSVRQYGQE